MEKMKWRVWAPTAQYAMCWRGTSPDSGLSWYAVPVFHVYVRTEPGQAFEDAGLRDFEGNEFDLMMEAIAERDAAETEWWGGEPCEPMFRADGGGSFTWRNWDSSGCDWRYEVVAWLACNDAAGAFDRWPDRESCMEACERDLAEWFAPA